MICMQFAAAAVVLPHPKHIHATVLTLTCSKQSAYIMHIGSRLA